MNWYTVPWNDQPSHKVKCAYPSHTYPVESVITSHTTRIRRHFRQQHMSWIPLPFIIDIFTILQGKAIQYLFNILDCIPLYIIPIPVEPEISFCQHINSLFTRYSLFNSNSSEYNCEILHKYLSYSQRKGQGQPRHPRQQERNRIEWRGKERKGAESVLTKLNMRKCQLKLS